MQFAAATVIIALLGLFVMRINFFNGIAVASAVTVFMVMVGALLLLPAVLSLLGTWAFVGRMAWITDGEAIPAQRLSGVRHTIGRFFRWVGWVLVPARHAVIGLAYAVGSLHARQGARAAPPERLRALWQLAAEASVAARQRRVDRDAGDRDPDAVAAPGVLRRLRHRPRDAAADRVRPNRRGIRPRRQRAVLHRRAATRGWRPGGGQPAHRCAEGRPGRGACGRAPVAADAKVVPIQVYPTTAPQDEATTDLLFHLREDVIPAARLTPVRRRMSVASRP